MWKRINFKNILYSGYLGLFMGLVIQVLYGQYKYINLFILVLIASTLVGIIIGAITEFLTALLPIRLASTKVYYAVNNVFALIATVTIYALFTSMLDLKKYPKNNIAMLITICSFITFCNLIVYFRHKYINRKLQEYKK